MESCFSYNQIEIIKLTDNSTKVDLTLATHEKLIETVHIVQDASRSNTETQPVQLVLDSGNGGETFEMQPTMDAALVRPRPRQHGRSLNMSATHGWMDVVGHPLPLPVLWPPLRGRFPGDQLPLADSNQLLSTALNGGLSRQTGRTTLTNGIAASSLKAATLGG